MSFLMCDSLQFHHHQLRLFCRLVHFQNFWISGASLLPVVLCLLWSRVTIFSLGATLLFCNFRWFSIKAALAHHPNIQEVDKMLVKGAIEPSTGNAGFILMSLLFLCIWVAYDPNSTLSSSITLGTYQLLRCPISDRYGNLFFNRVTMLFLLISRMLIYIFLLLSITVTCYCLETHTLSVEDVALWAGYSP